MFFPFSLHIKKEADANEKGVIALTKRKTAKKAAKQHNKTPTELLPDMEFSDEITDEHPHKGFNRNSKKGRQGSSES